MVQKEIFVSIVVVLTVLVINVGCDKKNTSQETNDQINQRIILQEDIAIESGEDNPYAKDRYYCISDNDCYGSVEGDIFDGEVCGATECINQQSISRRNQENRCNYYNFLNYPLKGGKCECTKNKCTVSKPIKFIEVTKEHCRRSGLGSCNECNFEVPKGWGLSLRDWRVSGFNCKLEPSPAEGLQAYKYNKCGCGESDCVENEEEIYYFLYGEVIAEMAIDKESEEISSSCYLDET